MAKFENIKYELKSSVLESSLNGGRNCATLPAQYRVLTLNNMSATLPAQVTLRSSTSPQRRPVHQQVNYNRPRPVSRMLSSTSNSSSQAFRSAATNLFCGCGASPEKMHSDRISRHLKRDAKAQRGVLRVLLLGTGASGKSTLLRQGMLAYTSGGIALERRLHLKHVLYRNVFDAVIGLLKLSVELALEWEDSLMQGPVRRVWEAQKDGFAPQKLLPSEEDFLNLAADFRTLWLSSTLQEAYFRRDSVPGNNELHFLENLKLFMRDDVWYEIAVKNYLPADNHLTYVREPTRNVLDIDLNINGHSFRFIDVGGQLGERQKWGRVFAGCINSLLFVIAASTFNEYFLAEDMTVSLASPDEERPQFKVNRLQQALDVFEDVVCASELFYDKNTSVIIFFNKEDVLREKLNNRGRVRFREHFEDFPQTRDQYNLEHVKYFIRDKFFARDEVRQRVSNRYWHFTTAVDPRNMQTMFESVKDTVRSANIDQIVIQ